uniref:Uncharacterized protein n=1 Tax=Sipha flava TaxID=143950 RepID=A0A2S2R0M4_9HEMI
MIGRITFTGDTFELKIYVQIYKQTRTVKLRPFHPSVDIVAFQKFLDVIEVIVVCEKIIFSDPMHGTILHQKITAFFSPFCLLLFCCFCYNYSCSLWLSSKSIFGKTEGTISSSRPTATVTLVNVVSLQHTGGGKVSSINSRDVRVRIWTGKRLPLALVTSDVTSLATG